MNTQYDGLLDLSGFLAGDLSVVEQWRGRELQAVVRLNRHVRSGCTVLTPRQNHCLEQITATALRKCQAQIFPFVRRVMPGKSHEELSEFAEALATEYLMALIDSHDVAQTPNPHPHAWARLYLRRDTEVERLSGLIGEFHDARDRLIRGAIGANPQQREEIGKKISGLRFIEALEGGDDDSDGSVGQADRYAYTTWNPDEESPENDETHVELLQSLQKMKDWTQRSTATDLLAALTVESRIFGPHVSKPKRRVSAKRLVGEKAWTVQVL